MCEWGKKIIYVPVAAAAEGGPIVALLVVLMAAFAGIGIFETLGFRFPNTDTALCFVFQIDL